jgi:hypothetical protein
MFRTVDEPRRPANLGSFMNLWLVFKLDGRNVNSLMYKVNESKL